MSGRTGTAGTSMFTKGPGGGSPRDLSKRERTKRKRLRKLAHEARRRNR